jgi:hypothetical protein
VCTGRAVAATLVKRIENDFEPTFDALNRVKLHGMALASSEQMTNAAAQQPVG